jgi:glycosyltransferase involved in cell wall biosynthesis
MYCKYLHGYAVTYIGFDSGRERIDLESVDVKYVSLSGTFFDRAIRFYGSIYNELRAHDYDVVFIKNFDFCFLIRLFDFRPRYVLDIRSGSVKWSRNHRKFQNLKIKLNTLFFRYITVISEGLAEQLNLRNYHIVPLASDIYSRKPKSYRDLKLVYIGTLGDRNIHHTVEGLKIFLNNNRVQGLEYHLFGTAAEHQVKLVKDTIEYCRLSDYVFLHGYKSHAELAYYWDYCNVGISYVPVEDFFYYQPPTKTYEYILSGMICIGTNTHENRILISDENGVLCEDNPESFAEALSYIHSNGKTYDSDVIRATLKDHTWDKVIKRDLQQYLDSMH